MSAAWELRKTIETVADEGPNIIEGGREMKRIIVMMAGFALLAAPALGSTSIKATAHDLSSGGGQTIRGGNDQICVYCHTPHSAGAKGFAPLWNRTTTAATSVYTGVDLEQVIALADVNKTDAPLCLSCHDGLSLDKGLNNPPNSGGAYNGGAAFNDITNANANLGTSLKDDHPIGFNYVNAATNDAEIKAIGSITVSSVASAFYSTSGVGANTMWCSSCHDVHNNTNAPFLLTTNSASTLCLACHDK